MDAWSAHNGIGEAEAAQSGADWLKGMAVPLGVRARLREGRPPRAVREFVDAAMRATGGTCPPGVPRQILTRPKCVSSLFEMLNLSILQEWVCTLTRSLLLHWLARPSLLAGRVTLVRMQATWTQPGMKRGSRKEEYRWVLASGFLKKQQPAI